MAKNYKTISGHVPLPVAQAVAAQASARNIKPSKLVAEILTAAVMSAGSAASVEADISARAEADEQVGAAAGQRSA